MKPENRQLVIDCFRWCTAQQITKPEFAAAIRSSDSTIYKIITARHRHPETRARLDLSVKMEAAMRRWLDDQRARVDLSTDFVITPTAKRVFAACDLALESRTPVFLYGPSQLGKTLALRRYAETHNHGRTAYVRLRSSSGLIGMLKEITIGLGESPTNSSSETLRNAIKGALARDMLLIVDEVHLLLHTYRKESFFACIEWLRELFDRVGCGMVLCVTKLKWDVITRHRRNELEQIFRRGVHKFSLGTKSGMPLKGDISMLLDFHGLDWPRREDKVTVPFPEVEIVEQPYDILRQLAKEEGMKALAERIRYGRKFATKAGRETVSWEDFCRAHIRIQQSSTEAQDWT